MITKIDLAPLDRITAAAIGEADPDNITAMQHASHRAILGYVHDQLVRAAGSGEAAAAVETLFAVAMGLEPEDAEITSERLARSSIEEWEKLEALAVEAKIAADIAECKAYLEAEGVNDVRKAQGKIKSADLRKAADLAGARADAQKRRVDLAFRY
jgi:hypothetical protein